MPLYTTLASLNTVAAANAADGTTDAPSTIDNNMNLLASFIAQIRDTFGPPPIGSTRNLRASLATAGTTATFTADEVVVKASLGGICFSLPSFSKTINISTTGAGGMDTGAAPVSGFVAIYAIYNATTTTAALLATNATAAVQPEVYGGANMPAGYTASALISVLPTNGSSQLLPFAQNDRTISVAQIVQQSTSTTAATPTSFSAGSLPRNARFCSGIVSFSSTAASSGGTSVFGFSAAVGGQGTLSAVGAGQSLAVPFSNLPIITPQTLYYTGGSSAGTPTFQVSTSGYTI